jgi:hypothetical protein
VPFAEIVKPDVPMAAVVLIVAVVASCAFEIEKALSVSLEGQTYTLLLK